MNEKQYEIKYQSCNLCNALHRNINDNFESVSFKIYDSGEIQVKVVLTKKTEIEAEYIDDMITEFEALQETNCVKEPKIVTGKNNPPLENLVYKKDQ